MTPEKPDGICRNGGCPRLATVVIRIPLLGEKAVCYHCQQALQPWFDGPAYRQTPKSGQTVSPFPGAA